MNTFYGIFKTKNNLFDSISFDDCYDINIINQYIADTKDNIVKTDCYACGIDRLDMIPIVSYFVFSDRVNNGNRTTAKYLETEYKVIDKDIISMEDGKLIYVYIADSDQSLDWIFKHGLAQCHARLELFLEVLDCEFRGFVESNLRCDLKIIKGY